MCEMTWVAILVLSWVNPAITTVEGFISEKACQEFGERYIKANQTIFHAKYSCVELGRRG